MHFFAIQTLFFCQTKAFSSSSNFQKIVTATTVISGLKTKKAGAKNAVLQVPRQTQLNAMPLALDAVSNFYKNSPYLAAFVTCGVKASAADLIAQSNEEKSADSSTVRRNFAFILYGGMYQGVIQEHIFNHIFPVLFGTSTSPMTVAMSPDECSSWLAVFFEYRLMTTCVVGAGDEGRLAVTCMCQVFSLVSLFYVKWSCS